MARRGRRTSARNHCVVDLRAEPALDLARPRRLGELVEAAFSLFWRHRAVFLTVSLIVVAPAVILVDGVWGRALVNGVDAKEPSDAVAASRLLGTFVIPPLVTALHVRIVQGLAQARSRSTRWSSSAERCCSSCRGSTSQWRCASPPSRRWSTRRGRRRRCGAA